MGEGERRAAGRLQGKEPQGGREEEGEGRGNGKSRFREEADR